MKLNQKYEHKKILEVSFQRGDMYPYLLKKKIIQILKKQKV